MCDRCWLRLKRFEGFGGLNCGWERLHQVFSAFCLSSFPPLTWKRVVSCAGSFPCSPVMWGKGGVCVCLCARACVCWACRAPCLIYEVNRAGRMWVFVVETDLLREEREADWPTHTHTHTFSFPLFLEHTHTHTHTLLSVPFQINSYSRLSVCLLGRKCRCSDGCWYRWLDTHPPSLFPSPSFSFHQCPLCLFTRLQSTVLWWNYRLLKPDLLYFAVWSGHMAHSEPTATGLWETKQKPGCDLLHVIDCRCKMFSSTVRTLQDSSITHTDSF